MINSPVTCEEHWGGEKELSTFHFNAPCWVQVRVLQVFERISVSQFAGISREMQDNRGSVQYLALYIYSFAQEAVKKIIKAEGWRGELKHVP